MWNLFSQEREPYFTYSLLNAVYVLTVHIHLIEGLTKINIVHVYCANVTCTNISIFERKFCNMNDVISLFSLIWERHDTLWLILYCIYSIVIPVSFYPDAAWVCLLTSGSRSQTTCCFPQKRLAFKHCASRFLLVSRVHRIARKRGNDIQEEPPISM